MDDLPGVVVPGPDEDVFGIELAHERFRADAVDGEGDGRHALADARRIGDAVDGQARRSADRPSISFSASGAS